jgi:hypothetical protein
MAHAMRTSASFVESESRRLRYVLTVVTCSDPFANACVNRGFGVRASTAPPVVCV